MAGLKQLVADLAKAQGFDVVGIAKADTDDDAGSRLRTFVASGWHGDMDWLVGTLERRASPLALWPEARSMIMLAMNYAPPEDPLPEMMNRSAAYVSVYARHRDYHDIIKGRLKQIAGQFAAQARCDVKIFVDTAPLMEKPAAQRAGLGWQGKHTNLVSRRFGSWLFLGAILATADLAADPAEDDHCGSCRACLDICPTNAFPAPYQLDARRCISYLTIEHKGHIATEFRAAMGNRVYGCDDCLAVCPWNKFAESAREAKLQARKDLIEPPLDELANLDDAAFRKRFSGSPVKRIGRARFLRNVMIAVGNSGDEALQSKARDALGDDSPLVRAMAVWALSRLGAGDLASLARQNGGRERDPAVDAEWRAALTMRQERV